MPWLGWNSDRDEKKVLTGAGYFLDRTKEWEIRNNLYFQNLIRVEKFTGVMICERLISKKKMKKKIIDVLF